MVILQVLSTVLIVFLLMSMMAKARPLIGLKMPGKTLHTTSVGLLPKLLIHRSSLLALLTGCIFGVVAGWMPLNIAEMIGAFALVVLIVPMKYTLTTKGVGIGNLSFQPWDEFSDFKARKNRLELANSGSLGRLTLFVKPAEMDNVLKYVQRHIKGQSSNLSTEGE
jgi:hypothetical protein